MGQTPAKYMLPSAPFGSSDGTLNAIHPAGALVPNPQTPLLPPGFTDPGTAMAQQLNPFLKQPAVQLPNQNGNRMGRMNYQVPPMRYNP